MVVGWENEQVICLYAAPSWDKNHNIKRNGLSLDLDLALALAPVSSRPILETTSDPNLVFGYGLGGQITRLDPIHSVGYIFTQALFHI